MPARKNRPGKAGRTPLEELHRQENEVALAEISKCDARNVVYWANGKTLEACKRLANRGIVERGEFSEFVFTLPGFDIASCPK